jgi:hypothetical protein
MRTHGENGPTVTSFASTINGFPAFLLPLRLCRLKLLHVGGLDLGQRCERLIGRQRGERDGLAASAGVGGIIPF